MESPGTCSGTSREKKESEKRVKSVQDRLKSKFEERKVVWEGVRI